MCIRDSGLHGCGWFEDKLILLRFCVRGETMWTKEPEWVCVWWVCFVWKQVFSSRPTTSVQHDGGCRRSGRTHWVKPGVDCRKAGCLSTVSLPGMPLWPGIHMNVIVCREAMKVVNTVSIRWTRGVYNWVRWWVWVRQENLIGLRKWRKIPVYGRFCASLRQQKFVWSSYTCSIVIPIGFCLIVYWIDEAHSASLIRSIVEAQDGLVEITKYS